MRLRAHISRSLVFLGSLLCLSFGNTADCTKKSLESDCSMLLKNFTYGHSFNLRPDMFHYGGEKIKFQHMLSKGNTYAFTLCDDSESNNQLVLEIKNKNGQLVATNYNKISSLRYGKVFFPCRATGVYTVHFSFLNMNPVCASSVMGFQMGITKKP